MERNSILINDLVNQMKNRLQNPANKIEGSFAIDNIETVAVELGDVYTKLEEIVNNQFLDTTKGEFLDRKALDYGLFRKKSTFAKGKVTFTGTNGTIINKDCIVSSDTIKYKTLELAEIQNGFIDVDVVALNSGSESNIPENTINKIITQDKVIYSDNLPIVTNKKAIFNGTDIEKDEDFRERLYFKIQNPATSGNKAHYKIWAESVEGVGSAKVTPLINGAGTVGITIVNANNDIADEQLIKKVKNYIANDDTGDGMAPIGVTLSVKSARVRNININVKIQEKKNLSQETIKNNLKKDIENYFKKIGFKESTISIARITDILFDNESVIEIYKITFDNESTETIKLLDDEIPKLNLFEVSYVE